MCPAELNKGCGSKFHVGSQIQQKTPEEGRGYTGRNVGNITIKMKTIVQKPWIIKVHQASSKKFRQIKFKVRLGFFFVFV